MGSCSRVDSNLIATRASEKVESEGKTHSHYLNLPSDSVLRALRENGSSTRSTIERDG